jgi:uncharacterized protein (TIGR02996 family)
MREDDFVRAVLADPKDNELLLVYSDWLEEQGDPDSDAKAEFLRLTVAPTTGKGRKGGKKAQRNRLQELAASLDTDWLAAVSRLQLENCQAKKQQAQQGPTQMRLNPGDFLCDRRWEDLRATDETAIRFCEGCEQNVHYCDTIMDARAHARQGHCVAVDLGVIRRKEDLRERRMWLGFPSEETLRQEEELARPDPVSSERQCRKEAGRKAIQGAFDE